MKAPGIHIEGQAAIAGTPVFGPLALDIEGGKLTCLLGPSGSGKSTLLRLCAGLAPQVQFQGRITCSDGGATASRSTLMQQMDMLLPWLDVVANVTLGRSLRDEPIDLAAAHRLIENVGLQGFEGRFPSMLSGGQRQRVALARSLMEDRPIILLDEPFSALDFKTRQDMRLLTARLLAGRTVLMVTHDAGEAALLADDILIFTGAGVERHAAPKSGLPRHPQSAEVQACVARLASALMAVA